MGGGARSPSILVALSGLGPVVFALLPAASTADPAAASPEHLEIELDHPAPGERLAPSTPFVRVSGRAGSIPFFGADVVIALDRSTSALLASGLDVDGDEVVGRSRGPAPEGDLFPGPPHTWSTDPGDTVFAAEIGMARALAQILGSRRNRVGLVSFQLETHRKRLGLVHYTEQPEVFAPVGAAEHALVALDRVPAPAERTRADVASTLRLGAEALEKAAGPDEPRRRRAILLLTHGRPAAPHGIHAASQRALEVARELGRRGIRVLPIALGGADLEYLEELARASGGRRVPYFEVASLFPEPPVEDLRPREMEIENATLAEPAHDLRLFRDGRFDAVVPLAPGENTIEIRAVLADGHRENVRRQIRYEPAPDVE